MGLARVEVGKYFVQIMYILKLHWYVPSMPLLLDLGRSTQIEKFCQRLSGIWLLFIIDDSKKEKGDHLIGSRL